MSNLKLPVLGEQITRDEVGQCRESTAAASQDITFGSRDPRLGVKRQTGRLGRLTASDGSNWASTFPEAENLPAPQGGEGEGL